MLERVVAARQLWRRASQRSWDLGTLMKYVCKVLIYHPPKKLPKRVFHHDSVLLQPAMNAGEFHSPRMRNHKPFGMIACHN